MINSCLDEAIAIARKMDSASKASSSRLPSPDRYFQKHRQGKALSSGAKKVILNVYSQLRSAHPSKSINTIVKKTAALTGVGVISIKKTKSEFIKNGGTVSTLGKVRPSVVGRPAICDSFSLCALRTKMHAFYLRNEIPTICKLQKQLRNDQDFPPMSSSTLIRSLKKIGFQFIKRNRNSALIDRDDIVVSRRKYLRSIRHLRKSGKKIYYLDETWIDAGQTVSKVWQDTTIKSERQDFLAGLSTGLKDSSGKGGRWIIVHAGSEDGLVSNACDIFLAKNCHSDYHSEMNGDYFEKWFTEKLLPNIEQDSIIVMDNAPFHSVPLENIPNSACKKEDIRIWLTSKGITWVETMLKQELLHLVASVKDKYDAYRIDTIAALAGHTVIRLPPYHCELNPVKMVWSEVKMFVARENSKFTTADVGRLAKEGIAQVTTEHWRNCVKHIINVEEQFWKMDCLTEAAVEKLCFTVNQTSDSSSSNSCDGSSDEMSGIEEL